MVVVSSVVLVRVRWHAWFVAVPRHKPTATWKAQKASKAEIKAEKFDYPIHNFYMSDPISRTSKTMAQCTEARRQSKEKKAA